MDLVFPTWPALSRLTPDDRVRVCGMFRSAATTGTSLLGICESRVASCGQLCCSFTANSYADAPMTGWQGYVGVLDYGKE